MKKLSAFALVLALLMTFTACGASPAPDPYTDAVTITLSDDGVTVEGAEESAVYTARDIVYYEEGHDFTYGEGEENDSHSAAEAAEHTVVHIAKAGTYRLSGTLSRGQIAVDLGDEAEADPNAVVTLILDGVDITCSVAPAIMFYHVYECGSTDNPTKDVDTSAAGANILLAEGSTNTVHGAYVARIYKPETVVLNEEGTEVEDAKKLHKYDGAVYSKMTMNVGGEGSLDIFAENEGLDTELHLTINGGNIHIFSGNDGINTNEDGVSVTTINGGSVNITVTGTTGEGDGIDSNGWLVINGGAVTAQACANSADAGIDSDMGIHINGGTVCASGHMLDRIEEGGQTYAVFTFRDAQQGEITLKNAAGEVVATAAPENDYSILIFSTPAMTEGTYSLWRGEEQLSVVQGGGMGDFGGGMMPFAGELPEDFELPEGLEMGEPPVDGERPQPPEGMELPEGMTPPEGMEMGENMTPPEGFDGVDGEKMPRPDGGRGDMGAQVLGEGAVEFTLAAGGNMFTVM